MKTLTIAFSLFSAVSTADLPAYLSENLLGVQQSRDVKIEGMGVKKQVTMNGGTLTVEGANCDIVVNGFANSIVVSGANVTVHADAVNTVKIEGANAVVYYRSTKNKNGRVASSVSGWNSTVKKVK